MCLPWSSLTELTSLETRLVLTRFTSQSCKNTPASTSASSVVLVATEWAHIIDLKQHTFIIVRFWSSEVQNES